MEKINTLQALNVFEKIMEFGHQTSEGKILDGVNASGGHDGYTVSLWDEYVSITINFHNTCTIDHIDKKHFENFLEKIDFIDRAHRNQSESH